LQRKVEDVDTKNLPIGREPIMMMMIYVARKLSMC
jgi:hypothetical protein